MSSRSECVLCEGTQNILIQAGARHAPEVEVRRCANCSLVFLWPRPSEKELGRYYTEFYRDDYGEPPVHERYKSDLGEAHLRVSRLLPFLHSADRLLEIGSGSGAFIDVVHSHVGEVFGVEPDAKSRNWIKRKTGLPVVERVTDVMKEAISFDCVVLFHVLEHILNPVSLLQSLRKLLRRDGKLIIEVPNVDDVLVSVYQIPAYLRFYFQKAHLYYFSQETLRKVLEKAGFFATIQGIQRYDLSNHIRWMLIGQPGGQGYYESLLSPVQEVYANALIRGGHSDTLWAIAKGK